MNDSRLREAASEAVASWLEWLHTKDVNIPTPRWLGAMEKLETVLAEPASGPKETGVEKGLIMGNPVAELQEKVKFLQGELVAVETKSGIESVFEQERAQGRVEAASDLRAKLEALRDKLTCSGRCATTNEGQSIHCPSCQFKAALTAILDGKG